MKKKEPRILLSWEIDPSYTPPFNLSSNQINVCRNQLGELSFFAENRPQIAAWTPDGPYDLHDLLIEKSIDPHFDLVVIWSSSAKSYKGFYNRPKNLDKFDCPILLILGDTHHMQQPISSMLTYVESEPITHITTMYDRQHLHFFQDNKSNAKIAWFPVASVVHRAINPDINKELEISLMGNYGNSHNFRANVIKRLARAGINTLVGKRTAKETQNIYSRSLININVSLNGDLNLRTHEILMAGGFLLTDELSEDSGFKKIFTPGENCQTYSGEEDLLEKIEYYLTRPKQAIEIAENGYQLYQSTLHPKHRLKKMLDWVLYGEVDVPFCITNDSRHIYEKKVPKYKLKKRIGLYEEMQEFALQNPYAKVHLTSGYDLDFARDILDLQRLNFYYSENDTALLDLFQGLNRDIKPLSSIQSLGFDIILN